MCLFFFFFNDTATTEIYTLSLHDALPISQRPEHEVARGDPRALPFSCHPHERPRLPPDARPRLRWPFERHAHTHRTSPHQLGEPGIGAPATPELQVRYESRPQYRIGAPGHEREHQQIRP